MGKLLNSELNAARLKDLVASFFSTRSLGISTGVCDLDQMHIATDPKLEQIFCSNSFLQTSNPIQLHCRGKATLTSIQKDIM